MKKIILVTALIIFAGLNSLVAQQLPINPIPSYNFPLVSQNTAFQERLVAGTHGREKREMNIVITSSSTHQYPVYAKVWVVKENGSKILGPFTVLPDHGIQVPIDHGKWGVIIRTNWNLAASVWID